MHLSSLKGTNSQVKILIHNNFKAASAVLHNINSIVLGSTTV